MGMRVLLTGMGGELGTRVTNLLEADRSIEAIVGLDFDPPRRRIPLAEFHRVDPRDRAKVAALVRSVDPTVVLHLGVYEPTARSSPATAAVATEASTVHTLEAAAEAPSLQRIVVRSGIEVYGRRRSLPERPDESVTPQPTSLFGRMLLAMEDAAVGAARRADVPLTALRLAPVVGPHLPSPLGRYLRLPAVPLSGRSCRPFSLLHQEDAAAAIVAAVHNEVEGPVNVVGRGAVTAFQAVRMGGRVPVPTVGLGWRAAGLTTGLWGAPLPDHVRELLIRGRMADGTHARSALGVAPVLTTRDVVKELYDWAEVVYLPVADRSVA